MYFVCHRSCMLPLFKYIYNYTNYRWTLGFIILPLLSFLEKSLLMMQLIVSLTESLILWNILLYLCINWIVKPLVLHCLTKSLLFVNWNGKIIHKKLLCAFSCWISFSLVTYAHFMLLGMLKLSTLTHDHIYTNLKYQTYRSQQVQSAIAVLNRVEKKISEFCIYIDRSSGLEVEAET